MKAEQVTFGPGNNQLLYFTSPSLLKDNRSLIFISDRTGSPNLFMRDLETGTEQQLTRSEDGFLKSYVYFDGNPYRGFGKASVSLNPNTGSIYYIQGRDVMTVTIKGESRKLLTLPGDEMTGFTHVSADDSLLCLPTVDAEAFEVEDRDYGRIDERVQTLGLNSYLRIINTHTGEELVSEKVRRGWITHVQFSPLNSKHILYNHEWPAECGIRRMWLWDGEKHVRLRTPDAVRSPDDWTCHEMWEKDGIHVIYHGIYKSGIAYIGRLNIFDLSYREIPIERSFTAYGHFTVQDSGRLVSDGYYHREEEKSVKRGEWISLQEIDWQKGNLQWIPLCRHGSSWDSQCSHPHPVFDHGDRFIYFTSDISGRRQIYRVPAPH
jgi:hypothetical protein